MSAAGASVIGPVMPPAVPVMPIGRPLVGYHSVPSQTLPPVHVDRSQNAPVPPVTISDDDVNHLRDMFPSIDVDVIRTLLENERGNRDRVVNLLLQMSE